MAIALVELDGGPASPTEPSQILWPRPALRVVDGNCPKWEPSLPALGAEPLVPPEQRLRRASEIDRRRARRARVQLRRRRLLMGVVAAGLCTGLALPLNAMGGAAPQAGRVPGTALTGATVYVVQPGDTLWSIASRFDRGGDARPLAEAIARETGSATVVPGERIAIP